MTRRPLSAIIAERAPALMEIPGVVGVYEGLCDDAPCLRIMVRELSDSLLARLPREVEGYPVEIEETGEIRPLDGS